MDTERETCPTCQGAGLHAGTKCTTCVGFGFQLVPRGQHAESWPPGKNYRPKAPKTEPRKLQTQAAAAANEARREAGRFSQLLK